MAENKDFQVNYHLNVKAGDGVQQLKDFSAAVSSLVNAQSNITTASNSINKMFNNLNSTFKNGNKKSYNLTFNTKVANSQLDGLLTKLTKIEEKSRSISMSFGSTAGLDQKELQKRMAMYAKARAAADKSADQKNVATANGFATTAAKAAGDIMAQAKSINSVIGKTVSGLKQLQSGFDVNIRTDKAKAKLNELIGLMRTLKSEANINMGAGGASSRTATGYTRSGMTGGMPIYMASMSRGSAGAFYNRPFTNRRSYRQSSGSVTSIYQTPRLGSGMSNDKARWRAAASNAQTVPFVNIPSTAPPVGNGNIVPPTVVPPSTRPSSGNGNNMQRAALNRLQYSSVPSWRSLPFAGMLNAYFMYNAFKQELGDAIQFTHTMMSAQNVLAATDDDVATFQQRFQNMTEHVRKIGVDTKYTMVEMAQTTEALAKAGFSVKEIKQSIRPVTDLALVSDTPIQGVAQQLSAIMHGYGVDTSSTSQVADILTNASVRSQVEIGDIAESMKMAAGFLNMAGVDFTEGAAAIAVLGNNGIRGTLGGTALRSMMTFMAKPTKQAQKTLDQLGVSFTEVKDVYGKQIATVRPLADIMEDLNKSGAGVKEMAAIFGKVGGTGAMYLVNHYDQLRELSESNKYANGMAHELGEKKQNTTYGLWEQVTSQWSEAFTKAYEKLEPAIQIMLRGLTDKLGSKDFVQSITSLGQSMLTVFDIATKIGTWFATNWHWLEPILFTGVAAKMIFKTAGALTNLVVAFGGATKLSALFGGMGMMGNIAGTAGTATSAIGGTSAAVGSLGRTLASTVNTGSGVTGAAAAIGAFGTSAVVASAAISALAGVAIYAGYEIYQLNQKKEALTNEIASEKQWSYPSLNALNYALEKAYANAVLAKNAKDALTGTNVGEAFSNVTGGSWWDAANGWADNILGEGVMGVQHVAQNAWDALRTTWYVGAGNYVKSGQIEKERQQRNANYQGWYNFNDQKKYYNISERATQQKANALAASTFDYVVKNSATPTQGAFALDYARTQFKEAGVKSDPSLYYTNSYGEKVIKDGFEKLDPTAALRTPASEALWGNIVKDNQSANTGYLSVAKQFLNTKSSQANAESAIFNQSTGFTKQYLYDRGFTKNSKGKWIAPSIPKGASEAERARIKTNIDEVREKASGVVFDGLKNVFPSQEAVSQIFEAGGFDNKIYGTSPIQTNAIFNQNGMYDMEGGAGGSGKGFGGAGGNYGGSGKMHSATPKQVNVSITNLMSIETIKLMSTSEGQNPDVQNLKEQLTQALIEVVHDFDSSWNA